MGVETYVDRARARAESEREAVSRRREALERFRTRLERIETDPLPSSPARVGVAPGPTHRADCGTDEGCRAVRRAFAETVRPHSTDDESESVLETIRAVFTDRVAVGLAPTTDATFTPDLERLVLAETRTRRAEAAALERALDREAAQLERAAGVVDEITDWLVEANETALRTLGFEALARRHETLTDHRNRCDELASERQRFLGEATSAGATAGVSHRRLVPSLYEDFPVDHPVLATVARLDSLLESCQRTVRAHLVRRV
ncbi:DUF7260 family protein [Halovivax limisalsi]|uniref:DUF7260 family protein n=1 Tax=Halovivax limisalsi TaxID=1453760 RepID=UPI001FFD1B07|nr:hypothetical protein [Halovivax limisalsi]